MNQRVETIPPPSRTVLHGHVSQESACIIHDYPMGRTYRCVKRMWVETCGVEMAKGRNKNKLGLQRVVYQTTGQTFNYKYTNAMKKEGFREGVEYFWCMHNANEIVWNAPHLGVYHGLVLLVNEETHTERMYVEVEALSPHPWVEHIESFRKKWSEQFDSEQSKVFEKLASKA